MTDIKKDTLVSIVIITYNSSKYVLETLESVKAQTYKNIELIVSDDCSTDDTIQLIENWHKENSQFIDSYKLLKGSANLGIAPNCNKGVAASKGEWIKLIAGDDILSNDCIEEFIKEVQKSDDKYFYVSKVEIFFPGQKPSNFWPEKYQFPVSLKKQQKEILKANFIFNAGMFFKKNIANELGLFDENYTMIEDYPFDYKVLMNGYEFFLVDKVLVRYRVNYDSTSRPSKQQKFVNERSYDDAYAFIQDKILPDLFKNNMFIWYFLRKSKIWLTKQIVRRGNFSDKKKNPITHKLLFINKFFSNKLRTFETKYNL